MAFTNFANVVVGGNILSCRCIFGVELMGLQMGQLLNGQKQWEEEDGQWSRILCFDFIIDI